MFTDHPSPSANGPREDDADRYHGAHVVQLTGGRPDDASAKVASLYAATVTVTGDRIGAAVGEIEWTWVFADIEAVFHGGDDPWTIFAVPGVDDHGVAVGRSDAGRFRRRLGGLLPESTPVHGGRAEVVPAAETPPVTFVTNGGRPAPDPITWSLPVDAIPVPDQPPAAPPVHDAKQVVVTPSEPVRLRSTKGSAAGLSAPPQRLAGITASQVTAWFGTHLVLDRVSLEMAAGRVTALIGPSGCGKSTFLRILNRMHELIPSAAMAGEVLLDGIDIYDPARKVTDARRQIGMVFQKPNPFPAMSIYDNVLASFQLTGTKITAQGRDDVVESCLRKAGLWNEVRDRLRQPGGSLSGGQQQRLCIARALAIRPRVLLMDEPCSALDPTSTRRIEQTIAELKSEVTIVIVTHNMQQAARVSDHCAFFLAEQNTPGVIVEHGPTEAMFHNPQDVRTSDYVNGRFG